MHGVASTYGPAGTPLSFRVRPFNRDIILMRYIACCVLLLFMGGCSARGPYAHYPCDSTPAASSIIRIDGPCAWQAHARSLVVVDGIVVGRYWEINEGRRKLSVTADDVVSVQVLTGPTAVQRYGPNASFGILLIQTRAYAAPDSARL